MDQQGAFAYDEGDRHARALKASLDSANNVMFLDTNARLWDSNGSTAADRIRIDQATGNFTADGNVKSSRMPEKDAKKNGQLLNGDQPLQAQAAHMESTDRNTVAHYRGNAMMWQGANRIQGDTIDLNHKTKRLVADGSVVSNLWEEPKDEDKKNGAKPVLTVVRAPHLVYTDENRLAVYTGGVQLTRPNMLITCLDLRAFLAPQGADNRLEKAFADGNVKIVQRAPDHTRTGTAEHSEYYTDDERVILRGGTPLLVDSVNGKEKEKGQAPEWIYRVDDGSLQGNGSEGIPVQSRILRTKKKN
jgi:lipopolysaccharide export system protein LptA